MTAVGHREYWRLPALLGRILLGSQLQGSRRPNRRRKLDDRPRDRAAASTDPSFVMFAAYNHAIFWQMGEARGGAQPS
jgi:hypothetical protein